MTKKFGSLFIALLVLHQGTCLALFPEEEKEPTYLTAGVSEYVVFNCDLDFPHDIPIPYILHWNRDGENIFTSYDGQNSAVNGYEGRIHLITEAVGQGLGQGSINLTNIRESDQGWYECRVIFPNRSPSSRNNGTWYHLAIDGVMPRSPNVPGETLLAVPPINKTVMEGESVFFDCITKNNKSTIAWHRDGIEIMSQRELKDRISIAENGTLALSSTIMGDLGEYGCTITNEFGESQSASAYLNVQYKAKVIYAPREVFLPYGKQALLDCHFRANPPLTNLRWEKDGFLFDPYNVQGVFYRRNGSLYFSKVDETHAGSYTCTPYNALGTEGPSPIIKIVQRPPVFTITPQHLYMRKLGDTLEIPCDARDGDLHHRPTIMWYKDGAPLISDRTTIRGGNLTIGGIQEQDRGMYQCAASNEAATIVADAELMVLNVPPRAPYNLSANSGKNSVTLTWIPGYVRPKMDYSIWYRPTDTTEWRTMKIVSRKITEATINNLSPGKEYEFMVLSQDKHGDGMFSKTIRIFTQPKAGAPINISSGTHAGADDEEVGPPRNVRVQATVEGYLVTWDPPATGRNQLRLYSIRWFTGDSGQPVGRAETTNTFYLVKTLEEEAYYTFEVTALSSNEEGSVSDRYTLEVPAYRRNRAISMGIIAAIGCIAAAIGAVWWAKRRFCPLIPDEK